MLLEIRDIDHLRGHPKAIQEQLTEFLGPEGENEQTLIFTSPRYLGMAFNPVNFYFRINQETELVRTLVEVNNTFGDRHLYPLNNLKKVQTEAIKPQLKKPFMYPPSTQ